LNGDEAIDVARIGDEFVQVPQPPPEDDDDGNARLPVLVISQGCTGPAVGRLLLATGLVVAGLVMTAVVLCVSWSGPERQTIP
jgi:hypothetical protein